MLKRIFWKGFWKNRKNFFWLILSGSLMNSILFSTAIFESYMIWISTGEKSDMVMENAYLTAFLIVYVLLFFVLLLSVTCYMRTRAKEYGILELSGLKQKHRRGFIKKEFLLIIGGSVLGGTILGIVEAFLIGLLMSRIYPDLGLRVSGQGTVPGTVLVSLGMSLSPGAFLRMLIISLIEFAILFVVCHLRIACLGISGALSMEQKSGQKPRSHPVMLKLGIGFCLLSWAIMQTYWGRVNKFYLTVFMVIGLYLLYVSVGGYALSVAKKNEKRYYRVITWLNSWYHRFYGNIRMMYIVTVMTFIAVFSYANPVFDCLPLEEESYYPYDAVVLTDDGSAPFFESLKETYGVEMKEMSCIDLTTPDFGEQIGISASEYEKLTGESIELEWKEIHIVYQRERAFRNSEGIDYGSKKPRIYIGQPEVGLWVYTGFGPVPSETKFDTNYPVKSSEERIITGAFGEPHSQNIIVFSDTYYDEVKDNGKGYCKVWMLNIPKEAGRIGGPEEAGGAMEELAIHGNEWYIYEKSELLMQCKKNNLDRITVYLISFLLISVCGILISVIKAGSDEEEIAKKYDFYYTMGMPEKKRRKGIAKEYRMTIWLPVASGMLVGLLSVIRELLLRRFLADWILYYLGGTLIMLVCLAAAYGITSIVLIRKMIKKTGRRA